MKMLALDTSSRACVVAAVSGQHQASRSHHVAKAHTRVLLPMIDEVLLDVHVKPADLETIVVGNGPGSFIGLRIAASVAQGLAYSTGAKVAPVSSMAAIACDVGEPGDVVIVCQDARMEQVYLGGYEIDAAGLPQTVIAERLQSASEIPELAALAATRRLRAAGAGWQALPTLLERNSQWLPVPHAGYTEPTVNGLLQLGIAAVNAGDLIEAEQLQPLYLRDEVARKPL